MSKSGTLDLIIFNSNDFLETILKPNIAYLLMLCRQEGHFTPSSCGGDFIMDVH
jgi:hypothetical protein